MERKDEKRAGKLTQEKQLSTATYSQGARKKRPIKGLIFICWPRKRSSGKNSQGGRGFRMNNTHKLAIHESAGYASAEKRLCTINQRSALVVHVDVLELGALLDGSHRGSVILGHGNCVVQTKQELIGYN